MILLFFFLVLSFAILPVLWTVGCACVHCRWEHSGSHRWRCRNVPRWMRLTTISGWRRWALVSAHLGGGLSRRLRRWVCHWVSGMACSLLSRDLVSHPGSRHDVCWFQWLYWDQKWSKGNSRRITACRQNRSLQRIRSIHNDQGPQS